MMGGTALMRAALATAVIFSHSYDLLGRPNPFKQATGGVFPVFNVSAETVELQAACALAVGIAAAIVPALQAARVRIVEGLRAIG